MRFYYGWVVVAALCIILFLSAGLGFYSVGVFIVPFQDEFGWTRGQVSVAMSISALVSGLFGPVAGVLVNKIGGRLVMGMGGLMMGVFFALLGLTRSLLYLYLVFGCMAAWRAGIMIVPISTVVSQWFQRRRGLAIGVATAGIGLGGLVMAPITAVCISAVGWRLTFLIMGALIASVVVPLCVFVVRQHPAERGLLPDGADSTEEPANEAGESQVDGWSLRQAVRTPTFFFIAASFSLAFATLGAVLIHIVPFLEDQGISREQAGLMLGFVSGVGVFGKIASGYLADRMAPRLVAASVFAMQALGLMILVQFPEWPGIVAFTLVFGYSMGAVVALQPMMVVYCFGMTSIATILGAMIAVTSVFNALGPVAAGVAYDISGTYDTIFLLYVGIDCLAALLVCFLGRRPLGREYLDTALLPVSE
jgi:MFS transporter, OFA family, oxalate/formate antiporter